MRRIARLDSWCAVGDAVTSASLEAAASAHRPSDTAGNRYDAVDSMQGDQEDEVLDQHALLPSMQDDPKLWMVKVRAGSEKAIVSLLMSRFLAERLKNKPWGVTSAFCQEMPPRVLLTVSVTLMLAHLLDVTAVI